MPAATTEVRPAAPVRSPVSTVIAAWLVPGAGRFLVRRRARAAIVFLTVLICFVTGLLMHGPMFEPGGGGDVLTNLIRWGGWVGDHAAGLLYFGAVWMGYAAPDTAGHTADYGSKFLVAAGLLNILAMVDAYEIATRQKD